jgi:hypothetical protein
MPLALLGGLTLAVGTPDTLMPDTLQRHCNTRYGYCVSVPAGLRALPPSDNGDRQRWQSTDASVKVSTWGSLGPAASELRNITAYAEQLKKLEQRDGSRLTYSFAGENRVVMSGYTRSGNVFYLKLLLRSGTESGVRIEYAPRLKATWDAQTVKIAASLTLTP